MTPDRAPFADIAEIKKLCRSALEHKAMIAPSLRDTIQMGNYVLVQTCYNGTGPDSMMVWGRKIATFLMRRYKVPVMNHDWRFTEINKLRKDILGLIGMRMSELDLAGYLSDWNFEFESQTQHFLDEWQNCDIFTEAHYTALLKCLWHDTNTEFNLNMRLYEVTAWLFPIWCYSQFKTHTAYKLTESPAGWSAWVS